MLETGEDADGLVSSYSYAIKENQDRIRQYTIGDTLAENKMKQN